MQRKYRDIRKNITKAEYKISNQATFLRSQKFEIAITKQFVGGKVETFVERPRPELSKFRTLGISFPRD